MTITGIYRGTEVIKDGSTQRKTCLGVTMSTSNATHCPRSESGTSPRRTAKPLA